MGSREVDGVVNSSWLKSATSKMGPSQSTAGLLLGGLAILNQACCSPRTPPFPRLRSRARRANTTSRLHTENSPTQRAGCSCSFCPSSPFVGGRVKCVSQSIRSKAFVFLLSHLIPIPIPRSFTQSPPTTQQRPNLLLLAPCFLLRVHLSEPNRSKQQQRARTYLAPRAPKKQIARGGGVGVR